MTALLVCGLLVGCTGVPSPVPGSTPTGPSVAAPAFEGSTGPSPQDTLATSQFTGTSNDVIAEVTNAGLACADAPAARGFEVSHCQNGAGSSYLVIDVYARTNGDLVGVDMTSITTGPTDSDTLMSFVAFGLGGAMGPDAFNAVSEEVAARLDGSSPQPVWVGSDLRLTVRVSGGSVEVILLAPDLAAAWGS